MNTSGDRQHPGSGSPSALSAVTAVIRLLQVIVN